MNSAHRPRSLLLWETGAQAQFAFEAAKYGFKVGQHDVSTHNFSASQAVSLLRKAVDAGMGDGGCLRLLTSSRSVSWLFFPTRRLVVRYGSAADAVGLFLESADAAPRVW